MIRKKVINKTERPDEDWVDLSQCAAFEVTSEEAGSPLENALNPDAQKWVAATPGEQIIRLTFDEPQNVSKIYLLFEETAQVRSQEFVLSWQQAGQPEWREIVRQQFNFSPSGTTVERENFKVSLERASALQLLIVPGKKWRRTRLALAIANRIIPSAFTSKTISRVSSVHALPSFDCRLPLRDTIRVSKSTRWSHGH